MKFRIQEKELKEAPYIIKVYNCELEYLLNYQNPFAYVTNKNGWKYDVYNPFDSCVYITTGYNPIGWRLPNEEKWIIKALEDKACTVRNDEAGVNKLLKFPIDSHIIPCYTISNRGFLRDSKSAQNIFVYGHDF